MIPDKNRNAFDNLVAGLSAQDRMDMLQRLNASGSNSVNLVETDDEIPEKNVSLHIKFQSLSFFYKFILWFRAMFQGKSSERIFNDDMLAELARKINRKERDNNERLRKLKERRRAYSDDGTDAGRTGRYESRTDTKERDDSGLAEAASDISTFLSSINLKEQDSRAVRRDSELERDNQLTERMDRENERERLDRERQREAERRKQRAYKAKGIER